MNRNTLGRKFNVLVAFAAAIAFLAGVLVYIQNAGSVDPASLMMPGIAYIVFLCSMILMAYIFNKKERDFALFLEKARRESGQRVAELNALRDISEMTKDSLPAEELLKLILDKAMQVVAVRNGSVFIVEPQEPEGLRLIAAKPPVVFKDERGAGPRRFSFVKSVIESGKALRIQDIEHDPRTMQTNDPKYGAPSFISMPVYKNKQVMAVMNLANKENGGIFTESDERILSIMLAAIGVGMENIGLQNKVQQQLAEIKQLQAGIKKAGGAPTAMNG